MKSGNVISIIFQKDPLPVNGRLHLNRGPARAHLRLNDHRLILHQHHLAPHTLTRRQRRRTHHRLLLDEGALVHQLTRLLLVLVRLLVLLVLVVLVVLVVQTVEGHAHGHQRDYARGVHGRFVACVCLEAEGQQGDGLAGQRSDLLAREATRVGDESVYGRALLAVLMTGNGSTKTRIITYIFDYLLLHRLLLYLLLLYLLLLYLLLLYYLLLL